MLLLPNPKRLMLGYLLGAFFASITIGLVIVFALPESSATKTTQHTLSPAVDIALGLVALVGAFVLVTGRHERVRERRRARKGENAAEPRWRRQLAKGTPRATFVIGMLLTLPGASYLAGLAAIHRLDDSAAATVLLVIGFNIVMLWLLELPLVCFAVAPDWTRRTIDRVMSAVRRDAYSVAVWGLSVIGALLVVKGVIGLLA
jgi:hypothetical protein